jgi:hypothetical protein
MRYGTKLCFYYLPLGHISFSLEVESMVVLFFDPKVELFVGGSLLETKGLSQIG